jgi:cytochrome c oxidase subunit 3
MSARPVIDVSELPSYDFDTRSPIWWGNLWMLAIETTIFALAFATYFYLRQNFQLWPPPRTEPPFIYNPLPLLWPGTANLVLLLASCVPMILVDRAARRGDAGTAKIGIVIFILCGLGAIALRFFEFQGVRFRWDSNAYGSIVWAILILHLIHLLAATLETAVIGMWTFTMGFDVKHRIDLTVTASYWYWVVAMWVIFYPVIYWVPRFS